MNPENSAAKKSALQKAAPFLVGAALTVATTIALMVLSSLTGGYATYSQAEGESAVNTRWTWPIIIHLFTVLPALVIGAVVMSRKKGDRTHRILGRVYGVLMLVTGIASFWIGRPGTGIAGTGFSFIHIFSVVTLVSIPWAIYAARTGNIESHEATMRGLYIGLCIAGLFTLIPGRLLSNLVFG